MREIKNLLIAFTVVFSWKASLVMAQEPSAQTTIDERRLEQFSSGARNLLRAKYGIGKSESRHTHLSLAPAPSGPTAPATFANGLVNNPLADSSDRDTQSETTLILGSGSNVVVGFNDSGSYNFNNPQHFTGFSVSTDGGSTFTDKGALPTDPSGEGDGGDPVLVRDTSAGTIYYGTLGFNTGERIQVFRSSNNGNSFSAPVNAAPGFTGTGDFQDKDWLAVDNFPGTGRGNVYMVWRHFPFLSPGAGLPYGIRFTSSTDGGATWGPNHGLLIADEGVGNVQGPFVTVGIDHAVYVFWLDQSDGITNSIKLRKSTDLGQTFGSTITVANLNVQDVNGDLGLEFRSNAFPLVAVNPINGDLYLVYDDTAGADRGNIYFTMSQDGGSTWSTPQKVNDDVTTRDQWQPAMAVTPDGKNLFIGFYDRRRDAANFLIDTFGVIGSINVGGNGSVTFGPNFRITSTSFPPAFGQDPVVITDYMGDYDTAVADTNFFYYTWGDNRLGNSFHANQPDVRLVRVSIAQQVFLQLDTVNLSGGNGDSIIDLGETNNLQITILNSSSNIATTVTAKLSTTTPGVTILTSNSAYADVVGNTIGTNSTPFVFAVSNGVACGSQASFTLDVTSHEGSFSFPFVLDIGSTTNLFSIDFESGLGPTTNIVGDVTNIVGAIIIDNTGNGLWHLSEGRGDQRGHSATHSLYYGKGEGMGAATTEAGPREPDEGDEGRDPALSGGGNYDTGTRNQGTFTLPPINLVGIHGRVALSFRQLLERERANPAHVDIAKVELSKDGGANFITVGGPFNTTSNAFQMASVDIQQANVDLTPFVNSEIILRWSFDTVDTQNNDFEGWYVDDIVVKAFTCPLETSSLSRQIVAQGVKMSNSEGVYTVFDGTAGTNILTQLVLTNSPHTGFVSVPVDSAGDGNQQIAVAGVRDTGEVDFEIRDGKTGARLASNSSSVSNPGEFHILASHADTNSAGERVIIVSTPSVAGVPVLDVFDASNGGQLYSANLDGLVGCIHLQVVALNRLGTGVNDLVIVGERVTDGALVVDVRKGASGEMISTLSLKKKSVAPFVAFAGDFDGNGLDRLVVLASAKKGAILNLIDPTVGKTLFNKAVLRKNPANLRGVQARALPGSPHQVVVMGSDPVTGTISSELYSGKGKKIGSFSLVQSVRGPFEVTTGDTNRSGRDTILITARNASDNKPVLLAADAVTGGSAFAVNSFVNSSVSQINLFAADVDADGAKDIVIYATRDGDGVVLFEVYAGVSGTLLSSFNQGVDFVGPRDSFGAHVGD